MTQPEFFNDAVVLRKWLDGHTVQVDELRSELRLWLNYFDGEAEALNDR